MSDFLDDSGDNVFGDGEAVAPEDQVLGLVVPTRARLIYNVKGELIYDELQAMELQFRHVGRPLVTFTEDDGSGDEA